MPENIDKCPFSKAGCRNCAVYRGRHSYIVRKEGEQTPEARIVKNIASNWQETFKEVLQKKEKDVSEMRTPRKSKRT
jgi:hypothetical protein